jgi:hypothetical protein
MEQPPPYILCRAISSPVALVKTLAWGTVGSGQVGLVWSGGGGTPVPQARSAAPSDFSGANPQLSLPYVAPMDARYATLYMYTTQGSSANVRLCLLTTVDVFNGYCFSLAIMMTVSPLAFVSVVSMCLTLCAQSFQFDVHMCP